VSERERESPDRWATTKVEGGMADYSAAERQRASVWRCWLTDGSRRNLNSFQIITKLFKLDSIQTGPSQAKKIEIKYGFKEFDGRNNILYRKFFIFEMDFD
jgi:hypothetical protein